MSCSFRLEPLPATALLWAARHRRIHNAQGGGRRKSGSREDSTPARVPRQRRYQGIHSMIWTCLHRMESFEQVQEMTVMDPDLQARLSRVLPNKAPVRSLVAWRK